MLNLVYFADPMCSWCYGFGPQLMTLIARLAQQQPVNVDIVMGGLRAYNTEVMDAGKRATILGHWQHVREESGLPFNDAALMAEGFVYDTEPACRAVVSARTLTSGVAVDLHHAIQRAFYGDGRDVTNEGVLADIAVACELEREAFLKAFRSDAVKDATRQDFVLTQRVGVTGFPTLCLQQEKQLLLLTSGFARAEQVEAGLQRLAKESAPK